MQSSGRAPLLAPQPSGDIAAEQLPQPASSNETQDTVGQLEQSPSVVALPKKPSILKTADSVKSNEYKRNISWQDQYGQSLTQVVEFEPSEHADSEYDDFEERGCCIVM
ncbi:hypothetical protein PLESTM_001118700 [Pleodorina starrii]|nr:hypothetical protein PLESTM_001118700 [Pleodorina starrii]